MQTERESTRRLRTDAHLYDRPDRAHRDMVHFDAPSASRHVGARVLAWLCGVCHDSRVLCVVSQCRFYSCLTSFWLHFLYSARRVARVQIDAWLVRLTCRTSCLAFSFSRVARGLSATPPPRAGDDRGPTGVERGAHVKLSATAGVAAPGPRLTSFACLLI